MEAFSDGVIAILITIMVLELHAPEDVTWQALRPVIPVFLAYVLSFVFLGIYWANHHHMLQLATRVNGGIDVKGLASVAVYAIAIAIAFYRPAISDALYIGIALMWLVPDQRIERVLHSN